MNKTALICGSYAFDSIMIFSDYFKNHILPDKVHTLNVSFYVPSMRKEFGGCAGNITYNLNLLKQNVQAIATVGEDFTPYQAHLDKYGISNKYIQTIDNTYTAQAFITTDKDNNQITAFHPGAMDSSHLNNLEKLAVKADIAIVSPDGKQGMIEHAQQLHHLSIPFIFDPSQGLPMFNKIELLDFITQATWITLNDYEAAMLVKKTELSIEQIANQVEALVITKGAQGASIYYDKQQLNIAAITTQALDPTGCGDAYRSGLLYGLMNDLDWQKTGWLANLIGSIKVSSQGTQNHHFDLHTIQTLYHQHYGVYLT